MCVCVCVSVYSFNFQSGLPSFMKIDVNIIVMTLEDAPRSYLECPIVSDDKVEATRTCAAEAIVSLFNLEFNSDVQ